MTERNTALFDEIAATIERIPWAYSQGDWCAILTDDQRAREWDERWSHEVADIAGKAEIEELDCGTRMCIAGWAADLTGWHYSAFLTAGDQTGRMYKGDRSESIENIAREALGLTHDEATKLFAAGWGPKGDASVPDALRAIGRGAPILWWYEDESADASESPSEGG